MKTISTFLLCAAFMLIGSNTLFSQKSNWSQLADFPGGKRTGAFGFTIGTKFYIGGGSSSGKVEQDFWEYNIATGVWTRKADFAGGPRYFAIAFSIGSNGYAGTGATDKATDTLKKDFWQYNPAKDMWIRKADFGGGNRQQAFGAATATKGYAGTGLSGKEVTSVKSDSWEYDPGANKWTKRGSLGFFGRFGATAFVINGKVYAGTGINQFVSYTKDFYQYNAKSHRWSGKAKFGGAGRYKAVGFSVGSDGYLGTGYDGKNYFNDFWMYSSTKNKWTKTTAFPGEPRIGAVSFSYKNIGYLLTGSSAGLFADFWKFIPAAASSVIASTFDNKVSTAPAAGIKIFPNPAATQFTLSINVGLQNEQTTAFIYNMQGRLMLKTDLGIVSGNLSKTINISSLTTGMYKVVVLRETSRETASLVIAR